MKTCYFESMSFVKSFRAECTYEVIKHDNFELIHLKIDRIVN